MSGNFELVEISKLFWVIKVFFWNHIQVAKQKNHQNIFIRSYLPQHMWMCNITYNDALSDIICDPIQSEIVLCWIGFFYNFIRSYCLPMSKYSYEKTGYEVNHWFESHLHRDKIRVIVFIQNTWVCLFSREKVPDPPGK